MSQNHKQDPLNDENAVIERFEIRGSELVDRVKGMIEKGNVRRLVIRNSNDEILLVLPLTATVVAGGAMLIFTPILAALGAFAAFTAQVKVDVVHAEETKVKTSKDKVNID